MVIGLWIEPIMVPSRKAINNNKILPAFDHMTAIQHMPSIEHITDSNQKRHKCTTFEI